MVSSALEVSGEGRKAQLRRTPHVQYEDATKETIEHRLSDRSAGRGSCLSTVVKTRRMTMLSPRAGYAVTSRAR